MLPHVPQFWSSVLSSTQLAPQSVVGAPQPQEPPPQGTPDRQAWPHAPQLFGSLSMSMQAPLQNAWLVGQPHTPFAHTSPAPQMLPHSPQLLSSVAEKTRRHVVASFGIGWSYASVGRTRLAENGGGVTGAP
jgi:hypothetical protein